MREHKCQPCGENPPKVNENIPDEIDQNTYIITEKKQLIEGTIKYIEFIQSGKLVLLLKDNGDIFVKDELVENDKKLVKTFRKFLEKSKVIEDLNISNDNIDFILKDGNCILSFQSDGIYVKNKLVNDNKKVIATLREFVDDI